MCKSKREDLQSMSTTALFLFMEIPCTCWSTHCGDYALSLELYEKCGSKSPWPVLGFKQFSMFIFTVH